MFGHKKNMPLPRVAKTKNMILKAERDYVESLFPIVNIVLESYETMLIFISNWDLHTNAQHRKACIKEMETKVMPSLKIVIDITAQMKGTGNLIANSLWNSSRVGRIYADSLAAVCKAGNFQMRKWETKRKLYDAFAKEAKKVGDNIQKAFEAGTAANVKNPVIDDLRHIYLNDYDDKLSKFKFAAYR